MVYENQIPPRGQDVRLPYQYNAPHNAPPVPFNGVTGPNRTLVPPLSNQYTPKVQYDPRYSVVNACSQHRPSNTIQNQDRTPQRAYVAVPPPIPPSSIGDNRSAVPRRPQHPQADPTRYVSNGYRPAPTPEQTPHTPPLDYELLLLSMAEEYFAAAYGYGSMAAVVQREADVQEYYKLIATGLGCLEVVLSHFKILPEREAVVRLRYATVMYEETENMMEAEEALCKGISLCERHRFFDLKYNMQHLLSRMLFKKNPRAAFKFLDGITQDVEAYQHVAWVYAFRFLKVSLHLELAKHQDTLSALSQLRHIINISSSLGDKTILAIATLMEALTCLRETSDADNIEQAQRSLAAVRSLQLDRRIGELHQVGVLASIVDLCCHIQRAEPGQALAKMHIMQNAMKDINDNKFWAADGSFMIPFSNARMPSCHSQTGIVRKSEDGSLNLMFRWMPKDEIYNMGYLLSGIAMMHRNAQDGRKSEQMLEEGIKRMKYKTKMDDGKALPLSITPSLNQHIWREQVICQMYIHLAFILCARTAWSAAKQQLGTIQTSVLSIGHALGSVPETLCRMTDYLEAVISQGVGEIEQAVRIYQNERISFDGYRTTSHPSQLHLDVALLSTLNSLLIIRLPSHPQHDQLPTLLSLIEPLCIRNPNRQIQSAYHLLTATTSPDPKIIHTKSSLQSALQTAKQSGNNQLMCMVLNLMSWKFFRGVVGEQAEKSAQASRSLAEKCMDTLWVSVASGVLGDTLEAAGRIEEAKLARANGERTAALLPEAIQAAMRVPRTEA